MKKLARRLEKILGADGVQAFLSATEKLSESPRKSLRFSRRKSSARALAEKMGIRLMEAVPWCKDGFFYEPSSFPDPSTHALIATGSAFIQEAGAMEVVEVLNPEPGEKILDLCTAPGAKSTQIGERLTAPESWLVANDIDRDRARVLDALLSRHGIANSTVHNLEPSELAGIYPACFDAILVDAPCSGESLFAKRKERRADVSDREVGRCAERQNAILEEAAKMLAPKGRILYSTCTYSTDENEDVIQRFRQSHPEFQLIREGRRWPHLDQVAGGYFALLQDVGNGARGSFPSRIPKHGLIRNGLKRWDGKKDLYASVMAGEEKEALSRIELLGEKLTRFLRGERITLPAVALPPLESWVSIYDQELPVGIAQVVKDGLRPELPRALRF